MQRQRQSAGRTWRAQLGGSGEGVRWCEAAKLALTSNQRSCHASLARARMSQHIVGYAIARTHCYCALSHSGRWFALIVSVRCEQSLVNERAALEHIVSNNPGLVSIYHAYLATGRLHHQPSIMSFKSALIVVDVQEDFCPPVSGMHVLTDRR